MPMLVFCEERSVNLWVNTNVCVQHTGPVTNLLLHHKCSSTFSPNICWRLFITILSHSHGLFKHSLSFLFKILQFTPYFFKKIIRPSLRSSVHLVCFVHAIMWDFKRFLHLQTSSCFITFGVQIALSRSLRDLLKVFGMSCLERSFVYPPVTSWSLTRRQKYLSF
jgi:hypothetical protein